MRGTVETRAAQPYVAIPVQVKLADWGQANALVPEVFGWLAARGVPPAGALFYRYHVLGGLDGEYTFEVGVPVSVPLESDGRVIAGEIPAGTYAVYRHHGHPDQLWNIEQEFGEWLTSEGLSPDTTEVDGQIRWGGRFEFFMTNPAVEPDPNNWVTEVAWRLRDL